MSPSTRGIWRRPLSEQDRQRAFAAIAVALLLIAALLTLTRPGPEPQHAGRPASPRPTSSALAPVPRPTATATAPVVRARALARATEGSRQAAAAGRAFLAGYLPYLYGRRQARTVHSASPALRRQLARERPHRRARPARRPRVVAVAVQQRRDGWQLRARVTDGAHAFPVVLLLAERDGRPVVTSIGGE